MTERYVAERGGGNVDMNERYVTGRGNGNHGTAYNKRDWEVIDTERKAGNRIVCRATGSDARLVAAALNAAALSPLLHHLRSARDRAA